MYVIIRDDDTSFFTTPAMLQVIYGKVWDSGLPICLSVIPSYAAVEVPAKFIQDYLKSSFDVNIPQSYRGSGKHYPITGNADLCSFLNDLVQAELIEVCVHGLHHAGEFFSEDAVMLRQALGKAVSQLQTNFPTSPCQTFVPPYEYFSRQAREVLLEAGMNISTTYRNFFIKSWFDRFSHWRYQFRERWGSSIPYQTTFRWKNSKVFLGFHLFPSHLSPSQGLEEAIRYFEGCRASNNVFIGVSHYWSFFNNWEKINADLLKAWYEFLEYLRVQTDVQWITFSQYDLGK